MFVGSINSQSFLGKYNISDAYKTAQKMVKIGEIRQGYLSVGGTNVETRMFGYQPSGTNIQTNIKNSSKKFIFNYDEGTSFSRINYFEQDRFGVSNRAFVEVEKGTNKILESHFGNENTLDAFVTRGNEVIKDAVKILKDLINNIGE